MRRKVPILSWVAMALLLMAAILSIFQLVRYSRVRAAFPRGLRVAGVPVGGLSYEAAANRLVQVYLSPINLIYNDAVIQVRPAVLGYDLKLDNMLALADRFRTAEPFWNGFWRYLWNRPISEHEVPLQSIKDDDRVKSFLENEIAPRYNEPASPPMPIPGEAGFYSASPGTNIDYAISIQRINDALNSATNRTARLEITPSRAQRPSLAMLDYMVKGIIDASQFDGLVEFYMKNLKTGEVMNFTYSKLDIEPVPVGVAYSSWSTIKIPVLISIFDRLQEPYSPEILKLIEQMMDQSSNESTDALTKQVIERNLGPLLVTEDIQKMGLVNTFWSGYFTPGAPLLQTIRTPANQRADYVTDPDRYAQTTPEDMGVLLEEIYYCSTNYGGSIPIVFGGSVTQAECRLMIDYLSKNKIGVLIQAGVPEGTTVAHKHGWAYEYQDGYIHTIADSAIVYTPSAEYVLSIFMYHPVQAIFPVANELFANLSSAVYNYYNIN